MTESFPGLGVVLLAAGRAEMLRASLNAHADALDVVERGVLPTTSVVADRTTHAESTALIDALQGATVLRGDPGEPEATALARGIHALGDEIEHVLLSATDAAPAPGAILALLQTARATGADLTIAAADDPAPYALVRRRAAGELGHLAPGAPAVATLARRLQTVAQSPDAGQIRVDTSEVVAGRDCRGATLDTGHPEAVRIGYASYFGPRSFVTTWGPLERIRIGGYCSIASDVRVMHPGGELRDASTGDVVDTSRIRGAHRMATASTFPIGILVPDEPYHDVPPGAVVARPLEIGSDVWIGAGAVILGDVAIGHGAVIGAGAVVRRDVAPYEIVVGNPATAKRRRFEDALCQRLLAVRWWDWHPAMVRGNHERFGEPIADFLDRFDPAGALA